MLRYILIFSLAVLIWGDEYPFHSRWEGKIVGGSEATIEECPYQVSLQYITSHMCGASIISNMTILTAAHCVYGRTASSLTVWAGSKMINNMTDPGQRYFIDKILIHENYNTTSQDNDIALLKVDRPIKFNKKMNLVELAETGWVVPSLASAMVTGWGRTEEGGQSVKVLRKVNVTAMPHNTCVDKYGTIITDHMMCFQSPGKDSCQGDSGGPLVYNNIQIGVVSFGIGCARPEYPGVYTNIASERKWIDAHKNW